ncbi:hypothetical protein B0H19DRAFT_1331557 [Mycena capillaripes]|nr:hypothetical protein B0H19DRAFT_1331557 [Mycena capillaripes]
MHKKQYEKRSAHYNQRASAHGAGAHSTSPMKYGDTNRHRRVHTIGGTARAAQLRAQLQELEARHSSSVVEHNVHPAPDGENDIEMDDWVPGPRAPTPLSKAERLCIAWDHLLPMLEEPFTQYQRATYAQRPSIISGVVRHECTVSFGAVLIKNGLFPMSPTQPRMAVSIDLLDIYRALFERSCDAITALAAALHTNYDRRGFHIYSPQNPGQLAKDPFRVGLQGAVQWYSNLRTRLQARLDALLTTVDAALFPSGTVPELQTPLADVAVPAGASAAPAEASAPTEESTPLADPPPISPANLPNNPPTPSAPSRLTPGRADRILRERCPACFGLSEWGRPLAEMLYSRGGDVQLGADGCFSYRHSRKAGSGPISYDPSYFLSKEKVDKVGARIAAARKQKPNKHSPGIPAEVLEACEASWEAANEKKQKVDTKCHDASGVFVLTCRHSQPLFMCNIDTPGEQQKYVVALMEEVNSLLPPVATIIQAYDVGCLTDYSLNLYPILSTSFRARVSFVINAMHAYGHQWVCQLVYSPRLRRGLGLTEGEGVERVWSRIRKLIPITRHQWNSRRIWMIDQYVMFVNQDGRDSLGDWVQRQWQKNVTPKHKAAAQVIQQCRIPVAELRHEWEEQKAAQTSIRAHAPVRLRRELDKVFALQTQIEAVEQSIYETKKSITDSAASADSIVLIRQLEKTHEVLSTQAEQLYASLNIQDAFPELQNLPLEFVRTLLIMRDLKINIRKRAEGSFNEWDNLDRAVGGKRESLGTKLHQATRKAIARRRPALLRSITKFNAYCVQLQELRPPQCQIPIPLPLSTQLNGLRNDPSLYEDVWITPSVGEIPRWLEDAEVRDGIRNLHIVDRCIEEGSRLKLECTSMSNWLTQELAIVTRALASLTDHTMELALQQRQKHLQHIQASWDPILRHIPRTAAPLAASAAMAQPPAAASAASTASAASAAPRIAPPRILSFAEEPSDELFEASDLLADSKTILDFDSGNISDVDATLQEIIDNADGEEEEESSTLEADSVNLNITWEPPINLAADTSLLADLQAHTNIAPVVNNELRRTIYIEKDDLRRIRIPTGRLNNFGLNGLAAAFLNLFGEPYAQTAAAAQQCAVFSTYDLTRVRYKANDAELWRHVEPTSFWSKSILLIPIHRLAEEHWVLAVVSVPENKLYFFDSFGRKTGWRRDLLDVMILITRLVVLANRNQHPLYISTDEEWTAQPLFQPGRARQSNGHDCGLWVLCMMAAILRGKQITALTEAEMGSVRRVFVNHVLSLPFT